LSAAPDPHRHRHGWRLWTGIAFAVLIGLPGLLIGAVLVAANTAPGRHYIERLAGSLTGGRVEIAGLRGTLPTDLRLQQLQLRDGKGVWLTAHQIVLDWSPLALLTGDAHITLLTAQQITVLRQPMPAKTAKKSGKTSLPKRIDLDRLVIGDLALAAPIAGTAAQLQVNGQAHLHKLDSGSITLALQRTDQPGHYAIDASLTGKQVHATLIAQEPSKGLVSMAAHLPDLGAIGLDATLAGPRDEAALRLALAAGQLRADANGTLDLTHRAANLTVTANAPAMTPSAGIAWTGIALSAKVNGKLDAPAANGTLTVTGLTADRAHIDRVEAHVIADRQTADLTATVRGVALPPPNEGLLAGGPLTLQAHMQLDAPARPITYAFQQKLLNGKGAATLRPTLHAALTVSLPDLEKLAEGAHRDVQGHAGFTVQVARDARDATHIDLDAAMDVTGGANAPPAARGNATLGASVTLDGPDILVSRLKLDGATLHVDGTGARTDGKIAAKLHLAASDLHDLSPNLRGAIDLAASISGTQQDLAATADLTGIIGTATLAPGPVAFTLNATGVPGHPAGHLAGHATLGGAPLSVDIDATRDDVQGLLIAIHQADWRSASISGALTLPKGATLPTGTLSFAMPRLADLDALIGQKLAGSLRASVELPPTGPGHITLNATNAGIAGKASVARTVVDARITNPTDHPTIAATMTAIGIQAGKITGDLRFAANGPTNALGLTLSTTLHGLAGSTAAIEAAASLDATAERLRIATLTANWHDEHLALAAPATVSYGAAMGVDRLRLVATTPGAHAASIDIAGTVRPALALTVTARDITPALAKPFAPTLAAAGTIRLDAKLGGTIARPTGSIDLAATGLRLRTGPASSLPPADLTAKATLAGASAQIDTTLHAGSATHLALRGTVPIAAGGPIALSAAGGVDLALLDPILTAEGRRARGKVTLDATIGGTAAAPAVRGTLRLARGELQDYGEGVHITAINALIDADGRSIRIASFKGAAGAGIIGASGSIDLSGAMPVDIHITANDARPIASDLVTATLDANLAITGEAKSSVSIKGLVHIRRADIQVPDKLPASVPTLNVIRPGDKPPAPAGPPALTIPLDITLDAPQQIFVRGRGLDAELGGKLQIFGTTADPRTSGSIDLRRGSFSLAGQTLTFTSGSVSFNGSRKIDPALDFIATSANSDITATLTVGGYASAPTITLSSVPDRPQDEILAALLFNQSAASLSPFQLAQIGAALAQISGIGGGGPDPLSRLRKGLGLDRLSVGSSGNGTGSSTTSVEAGRYVAPGVYVGAKQGVTGSQTQAEVQIDLTKRLKLSTDIGSGTGGNNVGLTYQFQY
jgi:translocation and assembly module TamB